MSTWCCAAGRMPVMEIVFLARKSHVEEDKLIRFETVWGLPAQGALLHTQESRATSNKPIITRAPACVPVRTHTQHTRNTHARTQHTHTHTHTHTRNTHTHTRNTHTRNTHSQPGVFANLKPYLLLATQEKLNL
eukprot:scaffold5056_cov39-Tisochrysis_lutea.AAC.3